MIIQQVLLQLIDEYLSFPNSAADEVPSITELVAWSQIKLAAISEQKQLLTDAVDLLVKTRHKQTRICLEQLVIQLLSRKTQMSEKQLMKFTEVSVASLSWTDWPVLVNYLEAYIEENGMSLALSDSLRSCAQCFADPSQLSDSDFMSNRFIFRLTSLALRAQKPR